MNVLNHLKGNFILSGVGVTLGIVSKHFFKKEFLPVSSTGQMVKSYFFILGTSIVGKLTMDKLYEKHWLGYTLAGKDKVENEGFIGPLQGDLLYLISPNRWDNRNNMFRWADPDHHIP